MKFKVTIDSKSEHTFFGIQAKDGDVIDSKDWGSKEEYFTQKALKMPTMFVPEPERGNKKQSTKKG